MEHDTCRLCGVKPDFKYLKYIFDDETNLAQIINETLPIKVLQDDCSEYICLDCYNKIISFHNFIQNVLTYTKESKTKISFFEVNRDDKLQNVVISNLHNDMIYMCPNCNKDLILLFKTNLENSINTFEISLAIVDQVKNSVEENQISEDTFVNICTQKSSELHKLSLNHDMTNDNKENEIHRRSKNDTNHTNFYITSQKTDVSYEPNEGTKRKFQDNVSTEMCVPINPMKLLKLDLNVMENSNESNSDYDRTNVTDLMTYQLINNDIECLTEEIEYNEENNTEHTTKEKYFDENLTKSETLKRKLDAREQDELSNDYDKSNVAGLITIQPENNDIVISISDTEIKEEDDADDIDIPRGNRKSCKLCGARYISEVKYKFHMERHRLNKIDKYICLMCDKETKSENLLWEHYLYMHKKPTRWICLDCDKVFVKKQNLNEHQKKYKHSRHEKMLYIGVDGDNNQRIIIKQIPKCTVCKKYIRDIDANDIDDETMCNSCKESDAYMVVDEEAAKMISHRQYQCFKCRKHFLRQERLEFHEMRHNENMNEFRCSTCGKEFSGENSLYEHYLFVHKGARPHICEVCGKSFQLKARLKEHLRTHTGERPYQCEICGVRCMTTHGLKFHKRSHFPIRHACNICGKSFIKKQNLNEHLEKHWKKDKNVSLPRLFTCALCECNLPTFRMLKHHLIGIHQLDHHDPLITDQKPWYECNECQEKFKHQMSLKAHKEKMHEGKVTLRTFQCDICKIEYKFKQMLINHIKSKHNCEKQYKCAQCHMRFMNIQNLYRHVLLHTDRKPFACEYCNMNFKRKDARDIHRRKHTNNHLYECTDCNDSFDNYIDYLNHRKETHGDNEAECPECGKRYNMQEIRIHLNEHLGEKLSKLEPT